MSWHVKVPVEGSRHLDIVDDEWRTIAHVHRRTGMEPGEYTRNAHLLAEAPDLKAFEQTMIARRGEIEYLGVKYDKAVEALRACVAELVYVHECEVWINRGEERFAAIEAAREALQ